MYSEQGIIISLQVSPHFPALTDQLQSLEGLLPLSPTALKHLKFIFSLPVLLQTTFQVAGEAIPLPVSPVPFSMPEPASSSTSHLILAFSEHFYTSLFSALEESGALNVSLLVSGAKEEGRSGRYTLGGTGLPWEYLGGTASPTQKFQCVQAPAGVPAPHSQAPQNIPGLMEHGEFAMRSNLHTAPGMAGVRRAPARTGGGMGSSEGLGRSPGAAPWV